jgi:hypothetical protein
MPNVQLLDISFDNCVANESQLNLNWDHARRSLDLIFQAAAHIKVIDPHNNTENVGEIARAQKLIHDADVVYFLGFGFDQNNCQRSGSATYEKRTSAKPETVLFTNFNNSGRVDNDAVKALFGVPLLGMVDMGEYSRRFD